MRSPRRLAVFVLMLTLPASSAQALDNDRRG